MDVFWSTAAGSSSAQDKARKCLEGGVHGRLGATTALLQMPQPAFPHLTFHHSSVPPNPCLPCPSSLPSSSLGVLLTVSTHPPWPPPSPYHLIPSHLPHHSFPSRFLTACTPAFPLRPSLVSLFAPSPAPQKAHQHN